MGWVQTSDDAENRKIFLSHKKNDFISQAEKQILRSEETLGGVLEEMKRLLLPRLGQLLSVVPE